MSAWTDHVIDSHLIKAIFGEHCLLLTNVNLHEYFTATALHSCSFDLDLSEFPADPPKKWVTQRANTVQLRLKALDVRELSIIGVATTMTATVTLTSEKLAVDDEDTNLHTSHVDAPQPQTSVCESPATDATLTACSTSSTSTESALTNKTRQVPADSLGWLRANLGTADGCVCSDPSAEARDYTADAVVATMGAGTRKPRRVRTQLG